MDAPAVAPAENRNIAEVQTEALLELGMKFAVGQRDDAVSVGAALGPHDRASSIAQRQDRERAAGQEMLLGASTMIALMGDGRDDGGLAVRPAMGRNTAAFAQPRPRAVGSNEKRG